MAEKKTIELEIKSNVGESIADLKALKRQLKDTAAGSEDFKKLYNQIDDLEDKIKSSKNASSDWIDSLESAGGPLGMVGASLNKAKVATQSFGGALKATGIGLFVSLIGGLVAAFQDNENAMKKIQPLLNGLGKLFNGVFRAVEPLFNTLVDLAISALPTVSKAFGVVYSSVTAVFQSLGMLGSAIKKLISSDFSGAWKDAKSSVNDFSSNYDKSVKRFNEGTKEMSKTEKEEAEKRAEARKAADEKRKEQQEKAKQDAIAKKKEEADALRKIEEDRIAKEMASAQEVMDKEKSLKEGQETPAQKEEREYQEWLVKYQANNLNTELLDKAHRDYLQKSDDDYAVYEYEQAAKEVDDAKANADAKIAIAQKEKEGRIQAADAAANTLSGLSELLGKETAAGKAAAVASATINTFSSAQKAYDATVGIPYVGPILAPINAGIAIAAGIKNVKSILAVKVPGGGGGSAPSGGGGGGSTPAAPAFNVVGASPTNQLAQTIGNQQQQPIKAYVVSNDVTTAQSLDRNIISSASIG